jgi:hypothetical protein
MVRAIAHARVRGVLASAKVDGFRFCGLELHRGESASSMAAIAERLVGALSARTPKVTFAGFNLNGIWTFLGDDWIWHF